MRASWCRTRAVNHPLAAPADMLDRYLHDDPELSSRFARARAVAPPSVLGPMAVDARAAGEPGLLLAGDAAGFIDPMTGDGLHFALAGAELAAAVALDVLAGRTPIDRAHLDLAAKRQAAFSAKWRFNRAAAIARRIAARRQRRRRGGESGAVDLRRHHSLRRRLLPDPGPGSLIPA